MRSDVLRIYRSLHTWVGVFAGMALFIAFFAGALTMFEPSIARWLTPPGKDSLAIPTTEVDRLLPGLFEQHPAALAQLFVKFDPDGRIAGLSWNEPVDDAGHTETWQLISNGQDGFTTAAAYRSDFADFIDILHQTAGIPGTLDHEPTGVYFMGVVSVLYFLALVSGLIVLLPTLARDFMAMRKESSNKRYWLDVHNALGVASLPFHLLIAFTAIVFAFHDPIYQAMKFTAYGSQELFARPDLAPLERQGPDNLLPVGEVLQRIGDEYPEFRVAEMEYLRSASPGAVIRVGGSVDRGELLRGPGYGYLVLQPYTGHIVYRAMYPGGEAGWLAPVTAFFALHFGNYGGNFVRWLYFFMGVAGALVFYTGNLLWVESRRKRRRRNQGVVEQKRSARFLAALSVGVCLGSVAGVGLSLVSAKWLWGTVPDLDGWHSAIYYGVFLLSVAYALLAGAARSAPILLLACGVIALSIPFTTLLASMAPGLPGWARADSLAIDLVAGVAGVILLLLAHRVRRRVLTGASDSVWSKVEPA